MKLYKCDYCGRLIEEKYGEDLFMEGGWTMNFFDKESNPAEHKEDIAYVKHYCPFCSYPLY